MHKIIIGCVKVPVKNILWVNFSIFTFFWHFFFFFFKWKKKRKPFPIIISRVASVLRGWQRQITVPCFPTWTIGTVHIVTLLYVEQVTSGAFFPGGLQLKQKVMQHRKHKSTQKYVTGADFHDLVGKFSFKNFGILWKPFRSEFG